MGGIIGVAVLAPERNQCGGLSLKIKSQLKHEGHLNSYMSIERTELKKSTWETEQSKG